MVYWLWDLTLLIYQKLSSSSPEKLNQTVRWMKRLRSAIELFNSCLEVSEDVNEPRFAMSEVLGKFRIPFCCLYRGLTSLVDSLLSILCESIKYLRRPGRRPRQPPHTLVFMLTYFSQMPEQHLAQAGEV
jgi:hypothetical protein